MYLRPIVISGLLLTAECRQNKNALKKQSYKTHPLLPETEATLKFVYFWLYLPTV